MGAKRFWYRYVGAKKELIITGMLTTNNLSLKSNEKDLGLPRLLFAVLMCMIIPELLQFAQNAIDARLSMYFGIQVNPDSSRLSPENFCDIIGLYRSCVRSC